MNRIVREHYPVERLPEDLREGLAADDVVRVTVEARNDRREPGGQSLMDIIEEVRLLRASGKIKTISADDAVERVRALREEWSD